MHSMASEERKKTTENQQLDLVQIKVSKAEVDRRIAAFIEKKQKEVDDLNIREFCGWFPNQSNQDNTCARTDAVFVRRADCKSHMKVTKVLNEFGPQTRLLQEPTEPVCKQENRITIKQEPGCSSSSVPCSSTGMSCPTGLEERLHNLEDHLRLKTDETNVFKRIKLLEEKVLHLESLSPEYFSVLSPNIKRKKPAPRQHTEEQKCTPTEIDAKISLLKQTLMLKKDIKEEPS